MNSDKAIRKYYVGFGVLMLLLVGAVVYTMAQASAAKSDKQTNKAVEQISDKLISYPGIYNGDGVPASLNSIGLKNLPETVDYTKLSASKYKICFDYKTASNGFDAGWSSLLLGGFLGGNYGSAPNPNKDNSYFDSSVEFIHKKGQNCQTVSTDSYGFDQNSLNGATPLSGSSGSSAPACQAYPDAAGITGSVTVTTVDTSKKTITLDSQNQYLFDSQNPGSSTPAITTLSYTSNTIFCNSSSQKQTDISAVKAGQEIAIYLGKTDKSLIQVDVY